MVCCAQAHKLALLERPSGALHTSSLGTRFLLDEGHRALKRQFFPMQAVNGDLLDERTCMPDLEDFLAGVDEKHDLLTGESLLDGIRLQIDIHTAI